VTLARDLPAAGGRGQGARGSISALMKSIEKISDRNLLINVDLMD